MHQRLHVINTKHGNDKRQAGPVNTAVPVVQVVPRGDGGVFVVSRLGLVFALVDGAGLCV